MKLIDWLNQNSGFIIAVATVILVYITWQYARLTKQILKASNTPQITIFLRRYDNYIALCVQNIGTGYADDVKFSGDLSFKPDFKEIMLKDLEPYKSGLPYLGTGQKFETLLFHYSNIGFDVPGTAVRFSHPIKIRAIYKDATGKPVKNTHTFEFKFDKWEKQEYYISPIDDVTQALQSIDETLKNP